MEHRPRLERAFSPTEPQTAGAILQKLRLRLATRSETPGLDAQVLLAHVLGKRRAWLLAHPEAVLTSDQRQDLEERLARLTGGEPLPYVLGRWEFYGLDLKLSPETLIPRPETELLVDQARTWLMAHPGRRWGTDVGTGSGCVAIALAVHTPGLHLLASDLSLSALRIAQTNAHTHRVSDRIHFFQGDLLCAASTRLDLICANLPYIPSRTLKGLAVFKQEPIRALDGGRDGLTLVRRMISLAVHLLAPEGLALLEIEASQGKAAEAIAREFFPAGRVAVIQDLAGHDRLLRIENYSHPDQTPQASRAYQDLAQK